MVPVDKQSIQRAASSASDLEEDDVGVWGIVAEVREGQCIALRFLVGHEDLDLASDGSILHGVYASDVVAARARLETANLLADLARQNAHKRTS